LHKALQALQPLAQVRGGQLHCVVGCGGDRDATKRPLMAAAAEAHASHLCLTSDNPRSEAPQAILDQMVAGLHHPEQARVVVDRAQAIASQVAMAQPQDVVLIAGKGHETTQDVAGVKHPFSDAEHALRALTLRVASVQAGTSLSSSPSAASGSDAVVALSRPAAHLA
jgi:UDP-N-acetylmuramoyl-L-alanyl-D-glutamate--2,6-diaminopimelate ligase